MTADGFTRRKFMGTALAASLSGTVRAQSRAEASKGEKLKNPVEQTVKVRLADLIEDNLVTFTSVFTSESYIVHRLVGPSEIFGHNPLAGQTAAGTGIRLVLCSGDST